MQREGKRHYNNKLEEDIWFYMFFILFFYRSDHGVVVHFLSGQDLSFIPKWGESATHLNLCIGRFSCSILCDHFGSWEGQGKRLRLRLMIMIGLSMVVMGAITLFILLGGTWSL